MAPVDPAYVSPQEALKRRALRSSGAPFHLRGALGCAPALVAHAALQQGPVLLVCATSLEAQQAQQDLRYLIRRDPSVRARVVLVPGSEHTPYDQVHPERQVTLARMAALSRLRSSAREHREQVLVITTAAGLVRRLPPPEALHRSTQQLALDAEIDVELLVRQLTSAGYLRSPIVEDPGGFAVRGGLIDLWPTGAKRPVRIELFGDTIARIEAFDADTQRSVGPVPHVEVPPASELLITDAAHEKRVRAALRARCDQVQLPSVTTRQLIEDFVSGMQLFGASSLLPAAYPLVPLWQHCTAACIPIVDDPQACVAAVRRELELAREHRERQSDTPCFDVGSLYVEEHELCEHLEAARVVCCHRSSITASAALEGLEGLELPPADALDLGCSDHAELERALRPQHKGKEPSLKPLVEALHRFAQQGLETTIVARTDVQLERLTSLLSQRELSANSDYHPVQGELARGVVAPALGLVLLTEEEIFGHRAHRVRRTKASTRTRLEDLRALTPGDHVVHVEHGIGLYQGLIHKLVGDIAVDLLVVEYRGGDKLLLPVYRMNQIQKLGSGQQSTKLDRLGGVTFAKTKAKVKRKVRDMADELLALYAERQGSERTPLPDAGEDYLAFEAAFPFEETRDQANAIADVLEDLEKPKVMDRLICGDVGFGKTEVALRAAFRHVLAGNQVALLCPTTILANQHFHTVQRRFADQAVSVALMSRFRTKQQQMATIQDIAQGKVDIVVGTHRLLSQDVRFARLGLLIVDEEQRFGVAAKERIKQLKKDVDVLTLSATPIPRTLQFALGGLQDLSVIATAPTDRRSVRTTVARFDEGLVRDAIERELARGGQVYYVHNRVEGIAERAAMIQRLVPKARVTVGHGQMRETVLEKAMLQFVEGQADVLVATAIVESGLDIPRANTLIVDRADLFGLAQLYQLRGRVGRSSERAYCYLMVPAPSRLSDEAKQRVDALTRYSDLGSGLHIAELDLELRGAGDFLGAEQSGAVQSVGFELFCQMLEEATRELSGETIRHEVDPEITLDIEALLPEELVPEVGLRLSLYKRFASAETQDQVREVAIEVEDRFGPLPPPAKSLVQMMELKTRLRKLRITTCNASASGVTLLLLPDSPIATARVTQWVAKDPQHRRITPKGQIIRTPTERERSMGGLKLAQRLLDEVAEPE